MLYITYEDPIVSDTQWHIGEPVKLNAPITTVKLVQADNDELDHIRGNFHNIPINVRKRVNVWRGEFAKFIAENL